MAKPIKNLLLFTAMVAVIASTALLFCGVGKVAYADGVAEFAVELTSGKIFLEKNADKRLPMASTTKIMTAFIIAEDCDLTEVIEVPEDAAGVEGSSIYLTAGESISVRDLLYGLMLRSGNDAACALAIHHSGSVKSFVEVMNERAIKIGCRDTHFANPSGLPDEEHYTTARDLSNIACHAMQNQTFKEVVSTRSYRGDFKNFTNKNKLLASLDGANGIKTGYTEKAGRCLVSSAQRGKMDVVCVVLNCYDMFERSKNIIEDCFSEYYVETLSKDKQYNFNGIMCSLDSDCDVIVKNGSTLEYKLSNTDGDGKDGAVAKLQIFCENDLIFSHNLYKLK